MTATPEILIGSPVSGEEARFLKQLVADFAGRNALILANFNVSSANRSRQIDFVVVTDNHTELLEHKNFNGPILGSGNGRWQLKNFAGQLVDYPGENPWSQASQAKFVLSDAMRAFSSTGAAPGPLNGAFYKEFDASVCIYPQIASGSQLTTGNFKAYVRGYQDCLTSICSRPISSKWGIAEWRRFGKEMLKLRAATLAEAIDSRVAAALDRLKGFRTKLAESLQGLPPLPSSEREDYGDRLVGRLQQPENILLLGPSGVGKSFHLKHLVVRLSGDGHLPVLVQARRYRAQDFSTFVSQNLAPYYRGLLKDFLEAGALASQAMVLIVDGFNECPHAHIEDFAHGIQSFLTYSDGRVVVSGHGASEFPRQDTIKTTIRMAPLTAREKRSIYSHYSGVEDGIDHYCAAFSNAYDLCLAGKSHASSPQRISRTSLYDHYFRANVAKSYEALAGGLFRAFAAALEESVSFSMSRDGFDRLAESFLEAQGATLVMLDEIRNSRLLQVTDDSVSFEHELLQVYFRAEHLRRLCSDSVEFETQLRRPIHQALIEFVVGRSEDSEEILRFLKTSTDALAVQRMLQGSAGERVQQLLSSECIALLEIAEGDLRNILLDVQSVTKSDGKRYVSWSSVTNNRLWTEFEFLLFEAMYTNIAAESWRDRLLNLYFATEQALRERAIQVAERERFRWKAVWRETIRCVCVFVGAGRALPALGLLESARRHDFCSRHENAAVEFLEKVYEQVRLDPTRELSLGLLIAGTQELALIDLSVDVDRCIELLHWSFSNASPLTKCDALELFRRLSWHPSTKNPAVRERIKAQLQKLDMKDPLVNTSLIETLGEYDGIDPPVPLEEALEEFHRVAEPDTLLEQEIARRQAVRADYSRDELLAEHAYNLLGNIFEDVYLGVYYQAYERLDYHEKTRVLITAGMKKEPHGFATEWILATLLRQHDRESLPVFLRYATRIERDSPFLYEATTAFVISMVACAEFLTEPPDYEGGETPQDGAWSVLGRILFWHTRKLADPCTAGFHIAQLWSEASRAMAPAVPDVLRQLTHGMTSHLLEAQIDLVDLYPGEVRRVLEAAIKRREEISGLLGKFPRQNHECVQTTLQLLGRVGNDATASLLQDFMDDPILGKDALNAIVQIRRAGHGAP